MPPLSPPNFSTLSVFDYQPTPPYAEPTRAAGDRSSPVLVTRRSVAAAKASPFGRDSASCRRYAAAAARRGPHWNDERWAEIHTCGARPCGAVAAATSSAEPELPGLTRSNRRISLARSGSPTRPPRGESRAGAERYLSVWPPSGIDLPPIDT